MAHRVCIDGWTLEVDALRVMKVLGDPRYREELNRTIEALVRDRDFDEIRYCLAQLDEDLSALDVLKARVCAGMLGDVAARLEVAAWHMQCAIDDSTGEPYWVHVSAMNRELKDATTILRVLRRYGYEVKATHRALESAIRQKKNAMIRRRFYLKRAGRQLRKLCG